MNEAMSAWPESSSPLVKLVEPLFSKHGVSVYIKRDDLLRPFGGNKGRKLRYVWKKFLSTEQRGLVSMGGPFSNHLFAFASLCAHFDVPGIALVRGEVSDDSNPVLNHLRACGVEARGLSRKVYASRYSADFRDEIRSQFPGHMFVPEGGASVEGLRGCYDLGAEIRDQLGDYPDAVFVGAGTGTTAAGIVKALGPYSRVIAISALREKIIQPAFTHSLDMLDTSRAAQLELNTSYHFGGFAKWNQGLIDFIRKFEKDQNIALDPLYTAKTAYALYDLIDGGTFEEGSQIVFVHTGGMPGRIGFNYRFPELLGSLS